MGGLFGSSSGPAPVAPKPISTTTAIGDSLTAKAEEYKPEVDKKVKYQKKNGTRGLKIPKQPLKKNAASTGVTLSSNSAVRI